MRWIYAVNNLNLFARLATLLGRLASRLATLLGRLATLLGRLASRLADRFTDSFLGRFANNSSCHWHLYIIPGKKLYNPKYNLFDSSISIITHGYILIVVLFCFVLFCFVLFCFVLFCFVFVFHNIDLTNLSLSLSL